MEKELPRSPVLIISEGGKIIALCKQGYEEDMRDMRDMKNIPVYRYPATYAAEHGELTPYGASYRANIACKHAIEKAIDDHYGDNCLDGAAAVKQVVEQFGADRVMFVLANTVQRKDWDRRFSQANRDWAKRIVVYPDDGFNGDARRFFVVDQCHTGLTDLFLTQIRKSYPM